MPIDKLLVQGIRLNAMLGVLPWEQTTHQPVEIDVTLCVDTTELLRSGELDDGVDFERILQVVGDVVLGGHTALVETLADRIASELLGLGPVESVVVQVRKGAIEGARFTGVEVQRSKDER